MDFLMLQNPVDLPPNVEIAFVSSIPSTYVDSYRFLNQWTTPGLTADEYDRRHAVSVVLDVMMAKKSNRDKFNAAVIAEPNGV